MSGFYSTRCQKSLLSPINTRTLNNCVSASAVRSLIYRSNKNNLFNLAAICLL